MDAVSLEALVSRLCDLGVRATVEGDRVVFTPPAPRELRDALREHKAELPALLRRVEAEVAPRPTFGAMAFETPGVEREVVRDERGRVVGLASWRRVS